MALSKDVSDNRACPVSGIWQAEAAQFRVRLEELIAFCRGGGFKFDRKSKIKSA